ncbi:phage major capsid protein [candidate division KSB1 bacterium]
MTKTELVNLMEQTIQSVLNNPEKQSKAIEDALKRELNKLPDSLQKRNFFPGAESIFKEENKSYKSLFPQSNLSSYGFDSFDEFVKIAGTPTAKDNRLVTKADYSEGDSEQGGYLVPEQYVAEIFDAGLEDEIVRSRAKVYPMRSEQIHIPAVDNTTSHASSLYGGLVAYWGAEGGTKTQSEALFRKLLMVAKKQYIYSEASDEIVSDVMGFEPMIGKLMANGCSWYMDNAFLNGTGAGQPLGVINAPCTIEIAKETGQSANTILYDNLVNMLAQLWAPSFKKAIWVAHPTCLPQLMKLVVPVGTGSGKVIPVMEKASGKWSIFGMPLQFSEKMETLGTSGDIILADFSQYAIGLRQGLRFQKSIHANFQDDTTAYRIVARLDGQPLWSTYATLKDDSTTVSPFLKLATRA